MRFTRKPTPPPPPTRHTVLPFPVQDVAAAWAECGVVFATATPLARVVLAHAFSDYARLCLFDPAITAAERTALIALDAKVIEDLATAHTGAVQANPPTDPGDSDAANV